VALKVGSSSGRVALEVEGLLYCLQAISRRACLLLTRGWLAAARQVVALVERYCPYHCPYYHDSARYPLYPFYAYKT